MKPRGEGFRNSRDAEVCVCGHGRGEHVAPGKTKHFGGCDLCGCFYFRAHDERPTRGPAFEQACAEPQKFCGVRRSRNGHYETAG